MPHVHVNKGFFYKTLGVPETEFGKKTRPSFSLNSKTPC